MQPPFSFTDDEKRLFAAAILRNPNDPWKAAVAVFGAKESERGKCLYAATNWPNDETVQLERERLLRSPDEATKLIPSKAEVTLAVWQMANDVKADMKDRISAAKLAAEMQGYIEKPGTNITVPVNVTSNVMTVPVYASEADWEAALASQQDELTGYATASH